MYKLFKNDFCTAKTFNRLGFENIIHDTNILMSPNEVLLQVSETEEGIAFAGNLEVTLILENGMPIFTFTVGENFFLSEFLDENGLPQIKYEFGFVGEDFYNTALFLKFKHTFNQDIWYSNSFNVTNYEISKTTRFDYGDSNLLKSIRLRCYVNDRNSRSETKEYTKITGDVFSDRKVITQIENYKMYNCTYFDFDILDNLFSNDIIYANFKRISNKPYLKKGERLGDTNFFDLDFETTPINEKLIFNYQIFKQFRLVSTSLISDTYSLSFYNFQSNNGNVFLNFNKKITDTSNLVIKVYKNGILNEEIINFAVITNQIVFNINVNSIGIYDIIIDECSIFSGGESFKGLKIGFLRYIIKDAEYDNLQYNNNQYLTL